MPKIDDSYIMKGWIGIYTKDEFGNYEEDLSFRNIEAVEKYISKLSKALKEYKCRKKRKKKPRK